MEVKIKEWLRGQGYPLELNVAAALHKQRLFPRLANFYRDPVSGLSRQIDVIAKRSDATGFFQAEIVIECKKSAKHPWVVFSAEQSDDGFNLLYEYAITTKSARMPLIKALGRDPAFDPMNLPWMDWKKSRGVGVVPAFNNKSTDDAFKAVSGVMAAALARRKELTQEWEPMIFIFPVVIVDGDLFECKLNSTGDLDILSVDEARLYFPMPFGDEVGTCVHITTSRNLEIFANEARHALDELERFIRPYAKAALEKMENEVFGN
jgi:hypothetical protein